MEETSTGPTEPRQARIEQSNQRNERVSPCRCTTTENQRQHPCRWDTHVQPRKQRSVRFSCRQNVIARGGRYRGPATRRPIFFENSIPSPPTKEGGPEADGVSAGARDEHPGRFPHTSISTNGADGWVWVMQLGSHQGVTPPPPYIELNEPLPK